MKLDVIQHFISSKLKSLGQLIARHPLYFITIPCLLCAVFSVGITKMCYNRDIVYLYTTQSSKTSESEKIVKNLFPTNTSHNFDIIRAIAVPEGVFVMALPKTGNTMLTVSIFQELQLINDIANSFSIVFDNVNISYNSVCARINEKCYEDPIFRLSPHIKNYQEKRFHFKYPLDIDMFTYSFTRYIVNLGGVTVDQDRYVKSVKAIRLVYPYDSTNRTKTEWRTEWEKAFIIKIKNTDFKYINVIPAGVNHVATEIKILTDKLFSIVPIIVLTVALFSMATCMSNTWVRSKPWLGVSGCISAGMATITSFGILFYFDIQTTDMNVTLPFLILATEIDDAYVLISAWRRTDPDDSVEKRMGEAYSEAAVSITITSITNLLSFCIGITAPFPVVQIFCSYATVCILFTYIYQLTFFGGCMALSGYREKRNLHPFTFRKVIVLETDQRIKPTDLNIVKFAEEKFGKLMSLKYVKCAVILLFLSNICFGVWGITFLNDGMDVVNVLNAESDTTQTTEITYRYFSKYSMPIHVIINKPINYAEETTQKEIESLIKKFEIHPHITESFLTLSWLKYYKGYSNTPLGKFSLGYYNLSNKIDFINGLRNVFFRLPPAKQFALDVAFDEGYTNIMASRFVLGSNDLYERRTELQLIKDLQQIVEESPLPLIVHSTFFPVLEHIILIRNIAYQLGWIIGLLIIVVFSIFIPNLVCSICVAIAIVSSICITVGHMAFWNVNLDILSLMILILSAGFSINYPTHISYAFMMAKNKESNERLQQSIYELGWPIIQGSSSTILGVVVLGLQNVYSYTCFFKVVLLITVQTVFHALFVLPILLSLVSSKGLCKTALGKRK